MASLAPFISRVDLGNSLGEDLTASDAALMAVDAACDICRTEAEQTFNQVSNDTVVLDGTGSDALLLPERPVTSVSMVEVDDDAVTDYALNGGGILLRTTPAVWRKGRQNVSVTYTHGYADAFMPRDVRIVAVLIAARIFKLPASSGIQSETLGSYSVSYVSSTVANRDNFLTAGETRILRKYKQAKSF